MFKLLSLLLLVLLKGAAAEVKVLSSVNWREQVKGDAREWREGEFGREGVSCVGLFEFFCGKMWRMVDND